MKFTAIVLSAGKGSRMNSDTHKQYLLLDGKPIIAYALEAFEKSPVDEVILVTGQGEEEYCRNEIVNAYDFRKVSKIVTGGKERCHSVFQGLQAITDSDYVLIHDGARPFVTQEIIENTMETVKRTQACVVGVHAKDTIKITNQEGIITATPKRNDVWMAQTPQAFSFGLIYQAYSRFMQREDILVTDDAMVVEEMCGQSVRLIEGSYQNIKITTPEDLLIAETFLKVTKKREKR